MSDAAAVRWATVSQAGAALGVSERTVQRRCKSGALAARLETTADGHEWRIDPATLPTGAAIVPTGADSPFKSGTAPSVGSVPPSAAIGADSVLLAHLQSENVFLRGLVEQRDRDAAELRAALREALKMSNRAIMPPNDESAVQATQRAPGGVTGNHTKAAPIGSQRPAGREVRPLWARLLGYRPKW